MRALLLMVLMLLAGCLGKPDNIEPVGGFNSTRYLGKWYEIARLDQSFERGLTKVTATYTLREDGGLQVVNRGYDASNKRWKESVGKAYFVRTPDVAYLKVSFFGPFYGSYVVFDLDRDNYSYSLVAGPDKSYLWLLARTPTIDKALRERLVEKARALGYDTTKLVNVAQD